MNITGLLPEECDPPLLHNQALRWKSLDSLACFDELFKVHFVFGTSNNHELINVYNFLQTTIYEIEPPRSMPGLQK